MDYNNIEFKLNEFAKKIIEKILSDYRNVLPISSKEILNNLLNDNVIIVDKSDDQNIAYFGGIENIPSAHGGRGKNDGKIHVYPESKTFNDIDNEEDLIKIIENDILVHEIFHYVIQPDIISNDVVLDSFGHFITEGIVQKYAEDFSFKYDLSKPKSNYDQNVMIATKLMNSLDENKLNSDYYAFNKKINDIIEATKDNEITYEIYYLNYYFKEEITKLINRICNKKISQIEIDGICKHFEKIYNPNMIIEELENYITRFAFSEEEKEIYVSEIKNMKCIYEDKIKGIESNSNISKKQ